MSNIITATNLPECKALNCNRLGQYIPVMMIGSIEDPKAMIRIAIQTMPLCEDCKTTDPNEFMTDDLWLSIVTQTKAVGRPAPDRTSLRIEYEDILPGG